jgi:hypothetical protein
MCAQAKWIREMKGHLDKLMQSNVATIAPTTKKGVQQLMTQSFISVSVNDSLGVRVLDAAGGH